MERRASVTTARVRVRTRPKEGFDGAAFGREVKRRDGVHVHRVDVGAGGDERREALEMAARRGVVRRGHARVVAGVGIAATAGEEKLYHSAVSLVGGVVERAVAEGTRRVRVRALANEAVHLGHVAALGGEAERGGAERGGGGGWNEGVGCWVWCDAPRRRVMPSAEAVLTSEEAPTAFAP